MKQLVLYQDKVIEKKLDIETEKISIINSSHSKLRNKIQKNKELVVVQGGDEKVNRLAVETRKVDVLLSPEKNSKKDFMFFRNSGLNQVLCKLANKNKIAIGFSFSDVLNSKGRGRSKILARMAQNVKLCKKYKVKMMFSSFAKDKYELRSETILASFAKILGF
tara:strand:+ start:1417 stop:1908 length:492 start_codon:yes stop_codon:yes gene_type:complete